jgi:hypothetical protein
VEGVARSPELDTDGQTLSAVRLRASREGGTGEARLVLLEAAGDPLDEGESVPLDLPDDGAEHEIEVPTTAAFAPAQIAIEPFEGDGGALRLDWVRLDPGDPAEDGGGDGNGEGSGAGGGLDLAGGGGGDGEAAADGGEGCGCRAAGAGGEAAGGLAPLIVAAAGGGVGAPATALRAASPLAASRRLVRARLAG